MTELTEKLGELSDERDKMSKTLGEKDDEITTAREETEKVRTEWRDFN